jgi:hypothetical protein
MIIEGFARRFLALRGGKNQTEGRFTHQESLASAQVEPPNFEMSRAGRRFWLGNNAAITGIAPSTTIPTTAASWVIWNADPIATYFFEELGVYLSASGPAGVGSWLIACLFQAPVQSGASLAGIGIASMSNGGRVSKAIVKTSVTITQPVAPVWFPVADQPMAVAPTFPSSANIGRRDLAGAIAVPPGQGLGLAVIGAAGATPLFAPFARWIEQETDME